ncbi:MAG TPA: regulatory iron-sulfur-containing complex subunit RicT [Patescibacteria group bacterium]|nr:regulatory iron-sulfur-containing complex subunit RicT [Patescibacteria group bacterium]
MSKIVKIKFASWEKDYDFLDNDLDLKVGDHVIVDTELGRDIGVVHELLKDSFKPESSEEDNKESDKDNEDRTIKSVLRLATNDDYDKLPDREEKLKALKYCKERIDKHKLPMKLVDVHFSLTGKRLNFAFISEGRVDFRDLVRDLTAYFNGNIRLTQIGTRDEARVSGDFGPCGLPLCCKRFIDKFSSITSDMAECQQVAHRGSDRLSGMCNRLMCCLSYEQDCYKSLAKKMPAIGTRVTVDGQKGTVIGQHILKQSVDVEFKVKNNGNGYERTITEVDLNRNKKKKEE